MCSMSTPTATYRLADHVRACRIGSQVVLLDLKSGRYTGLGGRALSAWRFEEGNTWPMRVGEASPAFAVDGRSFPMAPLVQRGLLVNDSANTNRLGAVLNEPLASLNVENDVARPDLTLRHVLGMWASAAVAALWLRFRSLAVIAAHVESLRPPAPESWDLMPDPLRATVAVYQRARPFAFTARDQCLLDSLALIRYLAVNGFHAQWVIGVSTRPFHAHSWVQYGHVVLNDAHENVRCHRPILVV